MKKENEFYLRDMRSDIGSTCSFWNKGGAGYGSDLRNAKVFTFEEAQRYADEGRHFIPLSKSKVDAASTQRVDMQYLKLNCDFSQGVVINRHTSSYDGNDIYFCDGDGGYTANYNLAKIYTPDQVQDLEDQCGAILSKAFLDTICRPTIQAENVNKRKMITSSGIKYTSPRKRRETMGKTRMNCPCCGKISWQYNPYDFDGCSDRSCNEYKYN